jgi:cell surface protein SprA
MSASQSLIYAFDTNADTRANRRRTDGLSNSKEGHLHNYASDPDPAADDYTYYLNTTGGIVERYKNYNVDGNSAVDINNPNRGSTTVPDVEDVNKDNTMNTINAYYEYSIDVMPNMEVGQTTSLIFAIHSNLANGEIPMQDGFSLKSQFLNLKTP